MITEQKHNAMLEYLKEVTISKPVNSAVLESVFKLTGPEVRACIRDMRQSGVPIANDENNRGYYYARNYSELKHTIDDFNGRINSMDKTRERLSQIYPQTLF